MGARCSAGCLRLMHTVARQGLQFRLVLSMVHPMLRWGGWVDIEAFLGQVHVLRNRRMHGWRLGHLRRLAGHGGLALPRRAKRPNLASPRSSTRRPLRLSECPCSQVFQGPCTRNLTAVSWPTR